MTEVNRKDVRWKDIYHFTAACGNAKNPRTLATNILENINSLCPFDQALIFFLDGNKKICGQHLVNIDSYWSNIYLAYYADAEDHKYSCDTDIKEEPDRILLNVKDWDNEASTEFVPNYINARGLKYSCGFALFDLNGNYRTVFSLDRVKKRKFNDEELLHLQMVIPLLNNLHKNFYYQGFAINAMKQAAGETSNLTARETEITNMLCQGVSAEHISRTLCIAKSTTYRHIANIYEKLHVSSQQELLVSLLRRASPYSS